MTKSGLGPWLSLILGATALLDVSAAWAERTPRYSAIAVDDQPSPPATAPAELPRSQNWEVLVGDGYISKTLARWATRAGWQVVWDSPRDFPVTAAATVHGSFEDAVAQVVESLASTDAPIQARLYRNQVVRITRFEGQTADLKPGPRP